jgi:tRNA G18 (ribose-2'-O)-methylase SpoU
VYIHIRTYLQLSGNNILKLLLRDTQKIPLAIPIINDLSLYFCFQIQNMRKLKISELNRLTPEEFKLTEKHRVIAILDNVRSLHNVGSIFRTADALCIESVYLCGITATPPNNEIHKTALGAEDAVDWKYFAETTDAVAHLKKDAYTIVAVEQAEGSLMLTDFVAQKDAKYALIFGNEVKGVQQQVIDLCDLCVEIPQYGTKHSFNVSVSAGIVLWEAIKQLKKTPYDR